MNREKIKVEVGKLTGSMIVYLLAWIENCPQEGIQERFPNLDHMTNEQIAVEILDDWILVNANLIAGQRNKDVTLRH